jgi:hypothetical protein
VTNSLPPEVLLGATLRDQEYGWSIATFPAALAAAERSNLACLGGQIQFRFENAICEAYWLNADSTERLTEELWGAYVRRSCREVANKFNDLVASLDVRRVLRDWPALQSLVTAGCDPLAALVFVAYFLTDAEYIALSSRA